MHLVNPATADLTRAHRLIAEHTYGVAGSWAYDCFDYINAHHYNGVLPPTLILWGLTAYGHCLGVTHSDSLGEQAPSLRCIRR